MARGSGPATQGFLPGEFLHAASGVRYRVYLEKGEVWMSFDRDGDAAFERAPGRSSLGINLARALCLSGYGEEAKAAIGRVLKFNPDFSTARGMLKQLESGEVKCEDK